MSLVRRIFNFRSSLNRSFSHGISGAPTYCPYLSSRKEIEEVYYHYDMTQLLTDYRMIGNKTYKTELPLYTNNTYDTVLDYRKEDDQDWDRDWDRDCEFDEDEDVTNYNHKTNPNSYWMKDSLIKYCLLEDKWDDNITMVAQSKINGLWYLVKDDYQQGRPIEGHWPRLANGTPVQEDFVQIETTTDSYGVRLSFKIMEEKYW